RGASRRSRASADAGRGSVRPCAAGWQARVRSGRAGHHHRAQQAAAAVGDPQRGGNRCAPA
ncbi:hypothetical protein RZS08_27830, partial [Arthrospira platensis SPKY1]|nr:hypothetical protein [Arthrospira platensis SPKY1]